MRRLTAMEPRPRQPLRFGAAHVAEPRCRCCEYEVRIALLEDAIRRLHSKLRYTSVMNDIIR